MFKGRNQTCKSLGVLGGDGVVWLVVCPDFGGRGEAANDAVAQPTTTQTASLDVVATAALGVSIGVCGTFLIKKKRTNSRLSISTRGGGYGFTMWKKGPTQRQNQPTELSTRDQPTTAGLKSNSWYQH